MAGHYLQGDDGIKFLLSTADDAVITEVGTNILSLRGNPLSAHYDRQYKVLASAEDEVIVVKNSSVVAVLPDFDPDFVLGDECDLQDVLVENADLEKVLLYIAPGTGILNEGVEVFKDPCGNAAAADGIYYAYKFVLTVAGGVVTKVQEATTDDPNGELNDVILFSVKEKTGKLIKVRVYVTERADLLTKGATIFDDPKGETPTKNTNLKFKDYNITLDKGVVVAVAQGDKDPRK